VSANRRPPVAVAFLSIALAASGGAIATTAVASSPARAVRRGPARAGLAAQAPTCTPQALDASAQLDGAVTVSPMPGAADASPTTQISFLGVPLDALRDVTVVGSRSGVHRGTLEPYSQGDGGSFLSRKPFIQGETVTVSARLTLAGDPQPLRFEFGVAHEDPLTTTPERRHPLRPGSLEAFVSRPDLLPPVVTVHADSPGQAPGDEFLAPYGVPAPAGPMILDPHGKLLWFDPLPPRTAATNLRVQQLGGEPVLTWWQGNITVHGFGLGVDVIDNSRYETLAEVHAGNGYQADLHEFQITPAGTALLTVYNAVHCDLSALGAAPDNGVTDSLLQEVDIRTGLVMFEWTSLDHIPLTNSYTSLRRSSATAPFDFFHLNSINLDADGTLLVSSRNTWAVYDIDPRTGRVLWTLGGKHSSFAEVGGAATAFQHDARPAGPDSYSVFDNGASPQDHAQSRGVVLSVNALTHSVSVAAQYLHPGDRLLSDSQGDMQALANGDWFIGWGQEPDLSEFSATGSLLFDASLPSGYESYRALRFAWDGTPLRPPALVVRRTPGTRGAAYVSWNGATAVAGWELLEGVTRDGLRRIRIVAREGFETAITLSLSPADRFAAVVALDASGAPLGRSAAVALAPSQG